MKTTLMIAATLGLFTTTSAFADNPKGSIAFKNDVSTSLSFQAETNDGRIQNTPCFINDGSTQEVNWHSLSPQPTSYFIRISTCSNGQTPDQPTNALWSGPAVASSNYANTNFYTWDCNETTCTAEQWGSRTSSKITSGHHPYKAPVKK